MGFQVKKCDQSPFYDVTHKIYFLSSLVWPTTPCKRKIWSGRTRLLLYSIAATLIWQHDEAPIYSMHAVYNSAGVYQHCIYRRRWYLSAHAYDC